MTCKPDQGEENGEDRHPYFNINDQTRESHVFMNTAGTLTTTLNNPYVASSGEHVLRTSALFSSQESIHTDNEENKENDANDANDDK